jgi:hypothetical protein
MRTIVHFLISLLLWGIFFYHWHIVNQQEVTRGTVLAVRVLSTLLVLGIAITVLWVAHNLRIARIDQRKHSLPAPPDRLIQDTLGRPIEAEPIEKLQDAPEVHIHVTAEKKSYRTPESAA